MKTLKLSFTILIFQFFGNLGIAQQFIEATNANVILGVTNAGVDWGDYDNDDDLDLIMIGTSGVNNYSSIYTNNIGANYTAIVNPGISNSYAGSDVNWGDYDNDGDLDYGMTGSILSCAYSLVMTNIDINLNDFSIRDFILPGYGPQGVQNGSLDWGDFDNDGDYDLVIVGGNSSGSDKYTNIYENVDDSMILHTSLIGCVYGVAKWVDVDNDQDIDLFVSGTSSLGTKSFLYINNNGNFTNSVHDIVGVHHGDADFGDYDSDGDLDLFLVGDSLINHPVALLYTNASGVFTSIPTSVIPIRKSTVRWGDLDNDGDLDLVAVGDTTHQTFGNTYLTCIYRNDGSNSFVPIAHTIKGYKDANARWGDHDNDGDLDFILTGYNNQSPYNAGEIYANQLDSDSANTIPVTPVGLISTVNDFDVFLDWNEASDNETPTPGLNYNLSVGTSSGGVEIVSPLSNLATGYRKKAEVGNTGSNSSWSLKNLSPGDYYWRVQSIDGAFAGSMFSPENKFVILDPNAPTLIYPIHDMTNVKIDTNMIWYSYNGALTYHLQLDTTPNFNSPLIEEFSITDTLKEFLLDFDQKYFWRVRANTSSGTSAWSFVRSFNTIPKFSFVDYGLKGIAYGEVAFGDFDNDDDLDIAMAGNGLNYSPARLIYENINNEYVDYNAGLNPNYSGGCTWADFDEDNDLDLLVNNSNNPGSFLYENVVGVFTNNLGNVAPFSNNQRKTAWADFDNDGDLDFAYLGLDIYRNNNGVFAPIGAGFANTTSGDLAWGDYDNDLDMDLIVTGSNGGSGLSTRLYRNNGNSTFTEITGHGLQTQTHNARARWGDLDQDGDLDLLLAGQTSLIPYRWSVYLNNGGVFTMHQTVADEIAYGDIEWGDLDNDGDLDVVVSGAGNTYIYFYDSQFTREAVLQGVEYSSIDLGDYDNDQDLDILISGDVDDYPMTKLYKNNSQIKNNLPSPPTQLYSETDGGTVVISWNNGDDLETEPNGLTYNFYFSSVSASTDFATPMASIITGKRRIAALGNANTNNEWVLENVPYGTYYWSVQSIDNNYDGSLFAPEQTVTVSCRSNQNDFNTACDTYTWMDGNTYTESNDTATWVLTNIGGCDSIVTLKLKILEPLIGTDVQKACESLTWIDGNTYTENNNTATWSLISSFGCDSTVVLDLTILDSLTGIDTRIECESLTWLDGNTYTTNNNSATWTLTNSLGCDSLVTLDLTIINPTSGIDIKTACDTFTWMDGNTYTANNNTATWPLTNSVGCDSIVTLDLVITHSSFVNDMQFACESFTWIDGNTYTSSNNTAQWILTNSIGCDSVITLDLIIQGPITTTDTQFSCDSLTWIDGNTYTSSNNTAEFTLTNVMGCDSVITLNLSIQNPISFTDVQSACNSFTWIDGNTYTSNNNSASWILTSSMGCDSTAYLDLTINDLDLTITQIDDSTLQSNSIGVGYNWLDCDLNYDSIPFELNQIFIATHNGNYAVEITDNGCVDTSDCFVINQLGVYESDINGDLIYFPNPSLDGVIHIKYEGKIESIEVFDILGKSVNFSTNLEKNQLEVLSLLSGTYLIQFKTDQGQMIKKLTIIR